MRRPVSLGCGCSHYGKNGIAFGGFGGPNLTQDAQELTAAGYVVQAAPSSNILDAFGSQNRSLVEIGLAAVGVLVLVKLMK